MASDSNHAARASAVQAMHVHVQRQAEELAALKQLLAAVDRQLKALNERRPAIQRFQLNHPMPLRFSASPDRP
jgi:hypothetical protein